MPYYAVTLTPSPHKKHTMFQIPYKLMDFAEQIEMLMEFLLFHEYKFDNVIKTFEPTQDGYAHVHLMIQCDENIMMDFAKDFVKDFGYERNPMHHFIEYVIIKSEQGYNGWIDYMYKTYNIHMRDNNVCQFMKWLDETRDNNSE